MTIFLPDAARLLLQTATAAHDTMFVRTLPPVRTGFEQAVFVASGIMSILSLLLIPALIYGVFALRKSMSSAGARMDALLTELRPLVVQVRETSAAVKQTADIIRTDVESVHDTVQVATARVKQTVVQLADRVDDFNELLGTVHDKASMAVDVAGTAISGLAWGAKALRERRAARKAKKRAREVPAVKELDALDG